MMMFSEDSSGSFYPGPGGSVDTSSVWKPHSSHADLNNHNSKLNTWAPGTRGNKGEFVYDDASAKAAWNNGGRPENKGMMQGNMGGGNAWSNPEQDPIAANALLEQELFNLNIGKPVDSFTPGQAQWGRQEINQATPWEMDPNNRPPFGAPDGGGMPPHGRGFMQQPMHFDNGGNQWRQQWDNDGGYGNKGGAPDYNGPPFPGAGPMPGQFHGRMNNMNNFVPQQSGFNDRMPFQIRNGPPFHHGHHQPQQQPWMENKYGGGGGHHQMHHPMGNPNAGGRFPFNHPVQPPPSGPPSMMMSGRPPLMPMQPPHHSHHPPAGVSAAPPNFPMGTFQPNVQSDDSMWQDPNGELRKWQRDTGTGAWGDPAKQNASEIRRWLQPPTDSDEENILTPDPLRGEGKEEVETGWGPPPAPPGQKSSSMAPIAPVAAGGWSEPPRGPPPSNFGMPPTPNNFHQGVPPGPPANGWGGPPQSGPVGSADWTRSGPPNAVSAFQQPPPMGGFDTFGQPLQQNDHTRRLADKLRMACNKGLLDMDLLVNTAHTFNTPNASNTMKLLTEMFDKVAELEHLEGQAKQMELQGRKPEYDQTHLQIGAVKNALNDYREKIHAALSQKAGGIPGNVPRVSLADELTSMDHQPPNDLSNPIGGEVGPLW